MFPKPFDYVAAGSLDEACAALAANPGAKVLSGGMSLIPMMKLRVLSPPTIVDIGRVPGLDRIESSDGISIPALVRHHQVADAPAIRESASALAEAAGWTGDPQVRARGTTCGSVAHADAAADQPAALLALAATVVARSPRGTRSVPLADFFTDMFTTALTDDEIVERVDLPAPPPGAGSAYAKLGRRGTTEGFPIAAAAAWVQMSDGVVVGARVGLTAVSFCPVLSPAAAAAIIGTPGDETDVARAADRTMEGITPLADLHADERYKAHLATVMTRRALTRALARARRSAERYDIS